MHFDPQNKIIQLCAEGMNLEGQGMVEEAKHVFLNAWAASTTAFEKFTSAHYVARHQPSITDKLKWDETALKFALKVDDFRLRVHYPSLYLNIAKCHEDLNDYNRARKFYQLASSYVVYLPDDGYGKMISAGITKGMERINALEKDASD